jgi:cell fate (sporulation/competence/biofilm development) regulator YlbF (YheA/YmcA/DUF963 family)
MDQLVELAKRLGCQMASHERTTLLKAAQKEVNGDDEAEKLIQAYQAQAQRMTELEKTNQPIEVADKQKLGELEEKIGTHPALAELTRRQVDFVEMMRKVKQAIDEQLQIEV